MIWLRPARAEAFALDRVPPFLYQWGDSHACCGFPALDGRTVKVAQRQCGDVATASGVDRGHSHQEVAAMRDRVAEVVPGLRAAAPDRAGVGLYTNTPDGNFTVGPHPRCDRVLAACGFSGPEFKFAPVVGVAMADPVLEGETTREPGPLAGARTAPGRP